MGAWYSRPVLFVADVTRAVDFYVGKLGLAVLQAGQGWRVARLYWHSVEFGLARESGALREPG